MRVHKYRAWDKANKRMYQNKFLSHFFRVIGEWDFEPELMQFTGLLDKNGKEIYEGDVVKFNFEGYAKESVERLYDTTIEKIINSSSRVYWCDGGWWAIELWIGGSAGIQHTFGNNHINDTNIEIIGNIYSNPELIQSNE